MADDLHVSTANSVFVRKESSMFDVRHVPKGELLETLARVYVRPSLTEYERTQHDKINQELERQAEATERRFDIDGVAENVDNSL